MIMLHRGDAPESIPARPNTIGVAVSRDLSPRGTFIVFDVLDRGGARVRVQYRGTVEPSGSYHDDPTGRTEHGPVWMSTARLRITYCPNRR